MVGAASSEGVPRVSAFLIGTDGLRLAEYHKRVLVPFGEYVPFRSLLSGLIRPLGEMGEFHPGRMKQELPSVDGVRIGMTICYESVFPAVYRADAGRGAQVFVNLTNDGWYLDTAAPRQHLSASVLRAAETGCPVLRAANNGISAFIDGRGRIKAICINAHYADPENYV